MSIDSVKAFIKSVAPLEKNDDDIEEVINVAGAKKQAEDRVTEYSVAKVGRSSYGSPSEAHGSQESVTASGDLNEMVKPAPDADPEVLAAYKPRDYYEPLFVELGDGINQIEIYYPRIITSKVGDTDQTQTYSLPDFDNIMVEGVKEV